MSQVKLELNRLDIPHKTALAVRIVDAMTGNATFPTPNPALAAITTAATALTDKAAVAQQARLNAVNATTEQVAAEVALDALLTTEGNYVQTTSSGDEGKILSAGMDVRADSAPIGELPAPDNLSATTGDHPGQIDLHWNRVKGAMSYLIQQSADPPTATSWAQASASTSSKATMANLTSGTKYWFRVAALGAAGPSDYSQPAARIAP